VSNQTEANWLSSARPARLALAAALAAPIAVAALAIVVGLTVLQEFTFQMADPVRDSEFIRADAMGVIRNLMALAVTGALYGVLIGWPVTLIAVLPAHGLLMRKTSAAIFWYAGLGAATGLLAAGSYVTGLREPIERFGGMILIAGVAAGVVAGCLFWLIRRPDRGVAAAAA
jgi:hypothetical protein